MNCKNHPKVEAIGSCINCGNLFCSDCLIKSKGKNHCKECTAELLGGKQEIGAKTVVISQQQQQQESHTLKVEQAESKPTDWSPVKSLLKWGIGLFVLLLALGAIVKFAVISFVLFLGLGIYWIPPAQDLITKFLKEKYNMQFPRWARIIASIIVFFIAIAFTPK